MLKHLLPRAHRSSWDCGAWPHCRFPGCGTDELGTLQDELLAETKSAQIVQG